MAGEVREVRGALSITNVAGARPRIVIVDPVRTTLELLSYVLEQEGYQAVPFVGLDGAVQYLKKHSADLVVTECASPQRSETFDLQPLLEASAGLPVLVYTRRPELVGPTTGRLIVISRPSPVDVLLDRIAFLVGSESGLRG